MASCAPRELRPLGFVQLRFGPYRAANGRAAERHLPLSTCLAAVDRGTRESSRDLCSQLNPTLGWWPSPARCRALGGTSAPWDKPAVVGIHHVRDVAVALRSRASEPSLETRPEARATPLDVLVRVPRPPVLRGRWDLWILRPVAHIVMLLASISTARRTGCSGRFSLGCCENRPELSRRRAGFQHPDGHRLGKPKH